MGGLEVKFVDGRIGKYPPITLRHTGSLSIVGAKG